MQFIVGVIVGVIGCIWVQSVGIESAKELIKNGFEDEDTESLDEAIAYEALAVKSCLRNFHEQSNCYAQHSKQECDRLANQLCE